MNKSSKRFIQEGYKESKSVTRQYAKTFYFASLFLNQKKRYAAYAVYAFCRHCDNAVDKNNGSDKITNLTIAKEFIEAVYNDAPLHQNILFALKDTIKTYQIPKEYFYDLINGMYMDLTRNRYESFEHLYDYCYKVAGVVGLMMSCIFGFSDKKALDFAIKLGVAMQLTNILRDIKEDYLMGRIYLPQNEMKKYGLENAFFQKEMVTNNFKDFMYFQINRARSYYKESKKGIPFIPDLLSRFVVCAMKDIYSAILKSIENNQYDVFSQRVHVGFSEKVLIIIKLIFKGEYLKKI